MTFKHLDMLPIEVLSRRPGAKWQWHGPDVIAAWVADMDFPVAPTIRDAIAEIVETGDYGYPMRHEPGLVQQAFVDRMKERFDWAVPVERVVVTDDVIQALQLLLHMFSVPGDGVVVQTPIYFPFLTSIAETKRVVVDNPLRRGAERWVVDGDHLGSVVDSRTRMFLLCNPHNPCGRVFERDELEVIAETAIRNNLIVVADEIHADITYGDAVHIPFASLSDEVAARTITVTSATKSHNIAGLRCAVMVFGSAELQARFEELPPHTLGSTTPFGAAATVAAWTTAQPWLDELLVYLGENREYLHSALGDSLPEVNGVVPEATFLSWYDCGPLGLPDEPTDWFLEHAKVAFARGPDFGANGAGYVRINFATSCDIVDELVDRMAVAVAGRSA